MNPIIEVTGLGKSYQISHQHKAAYHTIKDDFARFLKKPIGGGLADEHETFWALKDVSFSVNKGEIFGIVGKNGSGKSTLLKILSRIVDPTEGRVELRGRTASLLEVGTGFHPELTGRENIYFNGSMLGMGRQEIRSKFDEIVEFSEVEKFLDTPVKFYSSGMYVRLAFSVAAHLEPEILILDEVLSVGDAGFQQKSLKKILKTMEEGRTVLIVSHSIDTVKRVCDRGILLTNGKIQSMGPIKEVIQAYEGTLPTLNVEKAKKLQGVKVISSKLVKQLVTTDSQLNIEMKFYTENDLPNCYVNVTIEDVRGQQILLHSRTDLVGKNPSFKAGKNTINVEFPRSSLNPGTYSVWFRIFAKKYKQIYLADSNRIIFTVKGKPTEFLSAVNIASKWQWSSEGL